MIKKIRHLWSGNDGATAVEFAFFAVPMAFLLIGMVEIGLMSTTGTVLQGATDASARLIRTGQAKNSGDPEGAFKNMLCEQVELLIDCNDLDYEVIKISEGSSFGDVAQDMEIIDPIVNIQNELQPRGFDPGKENSLIMVRVAYNYPLRTPFTGPVLADNGQTTKLLMATAIIQNEPYEF